MIFIGFVGLEKKMCYFIDFLGYWEFRIGRVVLGTRRIRSTSSKRVQIFMNILLVYWL
jgi:hypothetical protein